MRLITVSCIYIYIYKYTRNPQIEYSLNKHDFNGIFYLWISRIYIYIYVTDLQIQKCKKPTVFCAWNILSVGFAYIYIYIRNCISHCLLNIIFYLLTSRIYIYIRKTVMLNHVYQNHNCEILAFNILSVDPRFLNILTSSPLL